MLKNRYIFLILLLILSVNILLSCAEKNASLLDYQVYPMTVKGSYTSGDINAEIIAVLLSGGEGTVEYFSPAALESIKVTISEAGNILEAQGVSLPLVNKEKISDAEIIIAMLSLDSEQLVLTESADKNREASAVFETKYGRVCVTYNQEGIPQKFETEDSSLVFFAEKIENGSE